MFTEQSACDDAADDADVCRLAGRADFGDEPPIPERIASWLYRVTCSRIGSR